MSAMKASTTHLQHVRHMLAVSVGMIAAFVPVLAVVMIPSPVGATSEYVNASIADKALTYVGQWGGEACVDSRKPGDSGGQCRSFVNCIVWMTSGGTQNLGGRDYFRTMLRAGGQEITSIDQLQKGDIVQEGQGRHTFIIVGRVSGNVFHVVDSNHHWNEKVSTYNRTVTLNGYKRAFRMGMTAPAAPTPVPIKPIIGNLDTVTPAPGGAVVRGWVIDADVTRPVSARIYAAESGDKPEEGKSVTVKADGTRMDVAALHVSYGSSHGLRTFVALPKGNYTVCLYGVNEPNTPGEDKKLGCQAVAVQ